jgi:putative effector of murein hydrolase LrgA (UPF0299 family)
MPVEAWVQQYFAQFNGDAFEIGVVLAVSYYLVGLTGGWLFDAIRRM